MNDEKARQIAKRAAEKLMRHKNDEKARQIAKMGDEKSTSSMNDEKSKDPQAGHAEKYTYQKMTKRQAT